jgi:hypothetical protein
MAYSQASDNKSNTWAWVGGIGVLFYLWYEGYIAEWFGTSTASTSNSSSVTSGSITPTVSQVANTGGSQLTASQTAQLLAAGVDQSTIDLANESYYTWEQSGQPLSVLDAINAAAARVGSYLAGGSSSSTPSTSATSGATTPTVNQLATPSTQSQISDAVVAFENTSAYGSTLPPNILALLAGSGMYVEGYSNSNSNGAGATSPSVSQISAPVTSTVPTHTTTRPMKSLLSASSGATTPSVSQIATPVSSSVPSHTTVRG